MTGFLNSWLVLSEQSHRKAFVIRGINLLVLALLVQGMVVSRVSAQDWPMWRYDSFRSASSDNTLPPELVEKWSLSHQQRRQAWDDPLNLDLMTYDRVFEPVVINGRVIVPYNDESKVVAYSLDDGSKLWTFFAEAPVRLSAAGFKDKVCFCSDDGYLYCVDVTSGRLLWKFSADRINSTHWVIVAWCLLGQRGVDRSSEMETFISRRVYGHLWVSLSTPWISIPGQLSG